MKKLIKSLLFVLIVSAISINSQSAKVGWWKFDDQANTLNAEPGFGEALQLVGTDEFVEGFDTNDGAVKIGVGSHYLMNHQIAANGGGTKVNQYSILVDFKVENATIWHTFYQTNPANDDDGECFINTSGHIGTWATTYTEFAVEPNVWYRLVVSVENGNFYRYYINGELANEGTSQAIDDRHSLDSFLMMFGDNDGDDGEIFVSEVAIWSKALSSADVARIGKIDPSVGIIDNEIPSRFELSQNYPNPFNPSTTIKFSLTNAEIVNTKLVVFNAIGQQVAELVNQPLSAGTHEVVFNANNLPSGIYFYRLQSGSFVETKKMVLLK